MRRHVLNPHQRPQTAARRRSAVETNPAPPGRTLESHGRCERCSLWLDRTLGAAWGRCPLPCGCGAATGARPSRHTAVSTCSGHRPRRSRPDAGFQLPILQVGPQFPCKCCPLVGICHNTPHPHPNLPPSCFLWDPVQPCHRGGDGTEAQEKKSDHPRSHPKWQLGD